MMRRRGELAGAGMPNGPLATLGEKPSDADLKAAGKAIKDCFLVAITGHERLQTPDVEECERIAKSIADQARFLGDEVGHTILGDLESVAETALDLLPAVRGKIAAMFLAQQDSGVRSSENTHLEGAVQIEAIERGILFLLDRYGGRRMRKYTWHDLALWASNYGPGKSHKPDDPKCVFVQQVLLQFGVDKSLETISATLGFKRGPRSKKGVQKII